MKSFVLSGAWDRPSVSVSLSVAPWTASSRRSGSALCPDRARATDALIDVDLAGRLPRPARNLLSIAGNERRLPVTRETATRSSEHERRDKIWHEGSPGGCRTREGSSRRPDPIDGARGRLRRALVPCADGRVARISTLAITNHRGWFTGTASWRPPMSYAGTCSSASLLSSAVLRPPTSFTITEPSSTAFKPRWRS